MFDKEIEEHVLATTLHHFVEISRYEMQMCDVNKSYRQVLLVMMCQLQGIEPTIDDCCP